MSSALKVLLDGVALAVGVIGVGGIAISTDSPIGLVLVVFAIGIKIAVNLVEKALHEQR
jgi:hypothetical protein